VVFVHLLTLHRGPVFVLVAEQEHSVSFKVVHLILVYLNQMRKWKSSYHSVTKSRIFCLG